MNLVILGGGESGVGAAILGKKKNYSVFVSDFGKISDKYKSVLINEKIEFEEAQHSLEKLKKADLIIKSPGIPESAGIIKTLKALNKEIISEIEFAGMFTNAKKICITGSNGKTTTSMLLYEILKKGGYNVGLVGNIGKSFALSVAQDQYDYYVIEISSFQIDGLKDFECDSAVILNITPDHLDRYENKFQNYIDSKFKLVKHIKRDGNLVVCADDKEIMKNISKYNSHEINIDFFSLLKEEEMKAYISKDSLVLHTNEEKLKILINDLSLKGKHNMFNSMAAAIVSNSVGVKDKAIRESLSSFSSVEHRLEFVLKIRDVEFINDSKATNVNSTWYALDCMKKPVIWIAGGTDKGNDYTEIEQLVKEKVKAIICISKEYKKFEDFFTPLGRPIHLAENMNDAVKLSYQIADKQDVVLLSPACASFDRFKNYEARGTEFKNAVKAL